MGVSISGRDFRCLAYLLSLGKLVREGFTWKVVVGCDYCNLLRGGGGMAKVEHLMYMYMIGVLLDWGHHLLGSTSI
jgi:hypothetical protein